MTIEKPSRPTQLGVGVIKKGVKVGPALRDGLPLKAEKPEVLLVMSPRAFEAALKSYYLFGFGDTGSGFNADVIDIENKAVQSILDARFRLLFGRKGVDVGSRTGKKKG